MCLKSIGLDFPRVVIVQIVTACHAFHAIDSPTSGSRDSAADVVALVQDRDQDHPGRGPGGTCHAGDLISLLLSKWFALTSPKEA